MVSSTCSKSANIKSGVFGCVIPWLSVDTICRRSTIIKTWNGYQKCVKFLCCLSTCPYHTMSMMLPRPFRKLMKLFMKLSDDLKVSARLYCGPNVYC